MRNGSRGWVAGAAAVLVAGGAWAAAGPDSSAKAVVPDTTRAVVESAKADTTAAKAAKAKFEKRSGGKKLQPSEVIANDSKLKVKEVTVLIGNRVFPDFHDVRKAPLGQFFQVGETDYYAKVTRFIPDFAIDSKAHKVTSRSDVPRNPACQIVVREKNVPRDTLWAFVNFPPHFSPRSVLSFRVVGIDFYNAPPIRVIADTTGVDSSKAGK